MRLSNYLILKIVSSIHRVWVRQEISDIMKDQSRTFPTKPTQTNEPIHKAHCNKGLRRIIKYFDQLNPNPKL